MLNIPGVKLIDASNAETTPENYGLYGHLTTGKTHLAADAARFYIEQGLKVVYIVTPGEDPYTTVKGFDLGEILAPVHNVKEFDAVCDAVAKAKYDVTILDSMKGLSRITMDKAIGKDRYPVDGKEWGPAHDAFVSAVNKWKDCSRVSIFLCPADRSSDSFVDPGAKKPNLITCDLPGKMAAGIRGSVSYMGYIEAELDEKTRQFSRTITFVPQRGILTLARGLDVQMTEPIALNAGRSGNWAKIQDAFEAHRIPNIEGHGAVEEK